MRHERMEALMTRLVDAYGPCVAPPLPVPRARAVAPCIPEPDVDELRRHVNLKRAKKAKKDRRARVASVMQQLYDQYGPCVDRTGTR